MVDAIGRAQAYVQPLFRGPVQSCANRPQWSTPTFCGDRNLALTLHHNISELLQSLAAVSTGGKAESASLIGASRLYLMIRPSLRSLIPMQDRPSSNFTEDNPASGNMFSTEDTCNFLPRVSMHDQEKPEGGSTGCHSCRLEVHSKGNPRIFSLLITG